MTVGPRQWLAFERERAWDWNPTTKKSKRWLQNGRVPCEGYSESEVETVRPRFFQGTNGT